MGKQTELNNFISSWFSPQMLLLESRINDDLLDKRREIDEHFMDNFRDICALACKKQENDTSDAVSYISYSILQINFLTKKPLCLVETFNEDWYFSEPICELYYDPFRLTTPLYELYDEACSESKKYVGAINRADVERLILIALNRQINGFTELAKNALLTKRPSRFASYTSLKRKNLSIIVGKYRGKFKTIFEETGEKII